MTTRGTCFAYIMFILIEGVVMDEQKDQIIASFLMGSRRYLRMPGKVRNIVFTGLSRYYPSFFHESLHENDEDPAIGYEAGWAGINPDRVGKNIKHP